MQALVELDLQYTHGTAEIGPLRRPVYFDLGGMFDLMDDSAYGVLSQSIRDGSVVPAGS